MVYVFLLALSTCLAMVCCCTCPGNAGKGGERDCDASRTVDKKPTARLWTKSASAVNRVETKATQTIKAAEYVQPVVQSSSPSAESAIAELDERQTNSSADAAQQASDMNDVMDEMLNRSEIPADYPETMVAIFRDKSQGDVVRDFAVQHIGLYAETLQMRGKYDAVSTESATLRDALWDASE